jgi:hypothetical protein
MKKILAILLVIGSLTCSAQQTELPTGVLTSPNLVYSTVNQYNGPPGIPAPYTWSGFDVTQSRGGGTSGGNKPGYNVETGTFMFGYTQSTIAYNYALSTALKNSGMSWLGYNYSWEYYNQDLSRGTLSASIKFNALDGSSLHSKTWNLGATTEGWKTISGTEMFVNSLPTSNMSSFDLKFTGKDDRYWAGYYGPMVRNPSVSVLYTFDQCSVNPLSSPDCPGYAAAYKTQQCTANVLSDPTCPGYEAAYKTQQCAINPLYAADCPGYEQAFKTQQCTLDPLYSVDCEGYAAAYKKQQCTLDPLYATDCTGYAAAYKKQQCTLNALYATDCPGYEAAYKTQQCTANPLYAKDCPGYAEAYFKDQCIKDSLYDRNCEGYATAYAIKYLVKLDPATTTAINQQLTTIVEVAKADPAKVTIVNSTVDTVMSTPSTTSVTSPTSVNSILAPPPSNSSPVANATNSASQPPPPPPAAKQEERAQDQKKTDTEVAKVERKSGNNNQNARKEVAAKAVEVAKAAGKAETLEAQTAQQGLLVGLMGYVPGFAGYQQAKIPDSMTSEVAKSYFKPVTDNARAQRLLQNASDRVHKEMVNSQYRTIE